MTSSTDTIIIRRSSSDDAVALERLARLDSRRPVPGPHLVAESSGRLVAAISLDDGRVAADPFTPSAGAVDLLRERARHLSEDVRRTDAAARGLGLVRALFPAAPRRV